MRGWDRLSLQRMAAPRMHRWPQKQDLGVYWQSRTLVLSSLHLAHEHGWRGFWKRLRRFEVRSGHCWTRSAGWSRPPSPKRNSGRHRLNRYGRRLTRAKSRRSISIKTWFSRSNIFAHSARIWLWELGQLITVEKWSATIKDLTY